jgi:murein hydrolase activator
VAVLLLGCLSAPGARTEVADQQKTESELSAIRADIERISTQIGRDAVQRDQVSRELQAAEQSYGAARAQLERLRNERQARSKRRAALAAQQAERAAARAQERSALSGQIRAAYLIGRDEPLKLLLNQKDPARAGRMFVYYSYFGRARSEQIAHIESDVKSLEELDAALSGEEQKLAELEGEQKAEVARLEQARAQRGAVLASLAAQTRSRAQSLERLRSQQDSLEKLLREIRRATERFPIDSKDAFARLRGQLAWPVVGRLVARFGESRVGGVKWDGVLLATERGAAVHAVYQGRIVYADWLSGLGLLVIVDHGDGYLSLYAHNERLLRTVGERVTAGDAIAAAGDSGGRNRPELYFEIRKAGHPVDPRPWFRSAAPE